MSKKTFIPTSKEVFQSLPWYIQLKFPAHLTHRGGVDKKLVKSMASIPKSSFATTSTVYNKKEELFSDWNLKKCLNTMMRMDMVVSNARLIILYQYLKIILKHASLL